MGSLPDLQNYKVINFINNQSVSDGGGLPKVFDDIDHIQGELCTLYNHSLNLKLYNSTNLD